MCIRDSLVGGLHVLHATVGAGAYDHLIDLNVMQLAGGASILGQMRAGHGGHYLSLIHISRRGFLHAKRANRVRRTLLITLRLFCELIDVLTTIAALTHWLHFVRVNLTCTFKIDL